MANLGFLGADGKIFHLSSSGTSTTGKRKKDEEELNVAQTVTTPTVAPTTEFEQTQENLKKADKKLEDTKKKYQQELSKAYQKNNVNFKTEFNRPTNMISYQTKEQDKIQSVPKNQSEGILNAREMVEPERQEVQQASNDWLYANYLNNVARVGQEDTTMLDRLATPVRAIQDLVSPLTETGSNKYIDENGNVQFLPSYYSLKQEKVRNDTSGLGGLAMDIGYNSSKIMGAGIVDKFTGGMGGKALYWTDMSVDNFQKAKNEGYDNKQAVLNTIISTGSEYLTEKLLGGLAGKLTHGQASEVQNVFSNVVNKLIKNPKIANIIGSMGAEGLEEFTQEFIGAANDWITLGKTQDLGELIKNAFYSGLVGMGSAGISTGTSNAQGIITKENVNNMNNAITQLEQQRTNASKSEAKKIDTAISDAQNYVNKPFTQDYEKTAESVQGVLKPVTQQETNVEYSMQQEPSNAKIQAFRNSVQKEGIQDADGFYKAVEKIIQDKDYNVVMDSSIKNADGKEVNALISNDNGITIKINPNSPRAGEILLMHEVTHGIETKEMSDLIMNYASKNSEFNSALEDLKRTYGTQDVTPEVVADISGQLFGNQEFINQLSTNNPSIFRKIYDAIVSMANKLTGNSKESLFIKDLQNKWEKAYRESTTESAQKNLKEATRYSQNSKTTDNEGRILSKEQQNRFKNSKVRDEDGRLTTVYHTTTNPIIQFNEFNPVGTRGYNRGFGDQVVNFYTNSKEMSGSYAKQRYEMADTQKLNSIKEAQEWVDNYADFDTYIEGTDVYENGMKILNYKTEEDLLRNIKSDLKSEYDDRANIQYEGYIDIEKPYIVEVGGRDWNEVSKEIINKIPETIEKAETHKDELYKLAQESKRKNEIFTGKSKIALKTIETMLEETTNEELADLYGWGFIGLTSNYEDLYKNAKANGISIPSSDTKMRDILTEETISKLRDKKMADMTLGECFQQSYELEKQRQDYGNETSWFYKNYRDILGDKQNTHVLSDYDWFDLSNEKFTNLAKERVASGDIETNDVVAYIIAENRTKLEKEKYDGVIFKNVRDYVGQEYYDDEAEPADVYVTFNSNQFKAQDNKTPTDDADIRYSKKAQKWQDFLDKYFKSRGTTTNLKEKVSKGPALAEAKNVKQETNKVVKESFKTKEKTITKENTVVKERPKAKQTSTKTEKVVDNKITADTLKKMSKDLTKELNESFKLKKGEAYSRTPQTAVKSMSVYENAPSITDFDRKTVVHTIMSDEAAKIDAKARYEKNGSLEENAAYIRGLLQSDKRLTKNDKALAIYTMNEAYKQGNKAIGDGIVSDLTVLDVEAGQWAQASKLMKQMSPFGQLQTFVKMINNSVEKGNPRFKNVKITEEKINKVLDCYDKDGNWDADQFAKNMEEFKFDIQEQMTPTLMDKFNSVRMLGMLGSPRTHIRNMLGNVGNMGLRTAKNFNDRVMESVLIRNKEDRTRTFKPATKEIKDYVSNLTKEEILSGNKYDDTKTELERNMKVFNEHHKGMVKIVNPISKGMNMLSDGNSWLLDMEDKLFSSFAYRRSLQEYLTAKGMQTVEDIEANPQVLADGKAFAMQQGLEATYRQDSELATAISNYVKKSEGKNASKYTKFGGILVEANIPFKKTPINIAKTGIEYSPIGLTNGIYDALVNVKSGKVEMSQAIDEISKGATGLALLGIGALLAHSGMELTAADDEKDKKAKFDKSLGEKEYAIKIGNRYYDLSWMAPASMPLYTGIELYQTLVNEKQFDGNAVVNAIAKTIDPLSSMSLLEGLSKSVKSYSKTPGEFISKFTMSSLENYISQYVPTFLSQIANVSDDYKRTTTPSGKSSFTEFDKVWNNIKYKTPILRQTLPKQTDAWGRVQENDPIGLRIFNSFFNPANNSLDKKDATDKELERLYKDLGEDNYYSSRALPKVDFDKYLTFNKEKYNLSNAELTEFKKTYGKTAKEGVDKLVKTSEYKNATDEEKAKMLSSLYDYANQKAKEEYGKKHGLDYEDYKLDQLYSMVDAYNIPIEKAVSNKSIQELTADGNFTAKQKKLLAVDDIDGLTNLQKDALKRKFTMFMGRPGYKEGEYALVDALDDSDVSEETKEDIKRFLSLG